MNEPQKIFYLNQYLEREINSGGFDEYFCNDGSKFAYETVLSLKAIGANKTADILQRAIDLVEKLVDENQEIEVEVWDDLDEEFLNYEEDLNALNIEYIRKHKESF